MLMEPCALSATPWNADSFQEYLIFSSGTENCEFSAPEPRFSQIPPLGRPGDAPGRLRSGHGPACTGFAAQQHSPLLCNYPELPATREPFREIFSRRRLPFGRSVTLRAASPVFTPRRPNAERLCRHMIAARGRENHTQSYMLRGEQAPIMREFVMLSAAPGSLAHRAWSAGARRPRPERSTAADRLPTVLLQPASTPPEDTPDSISR